MDNTDKFLMVETPEALHDLCEKLRGEPWLALDTEFIREKTYYPQLCLIQVASPDVVACVDPLKLADMTPFLDLLYDPSVVKVFHSARQDYEIFYYLRGDLPAPLFDTQVAAPLLGYADQVGYANLVKAMLDIHVDKGQTRTDWSRRPLRPEQLDYAADDVRYLAQLYPMMREALMEKGRLPWLTQAVAKMLDPSCYRVEPDNAWRRIKATKRIKGVQLAVVKGLAAWRETQAVTEDRPRNWLLRDEALIDIARARPKDMAGLKEVRGLNERSVQRYGDQILAVVVACMDLPAPQQAVVEKRESLTVDEDAMIDVMMAMVRLRARENDLSPAALASRKDLAAFVQGDQHLLKGWHKAVIGDELVAFMAGHLQLSVKDKTVVITNC